MPVPKNIVSWNETPENDGYRLYRTTDPTTGYNQIGGNLSATLYEDTAV